MVGAFCLMSTTIVILYVSGNSQETDLEKCPEVCGCLGTYTDCSKRGFTHLPPNVPAWTTQLNLNSNRIHGLDKSILANLSQLSDLKLNRNKITHLSKETFKHQEHLRILELNRNQLETIEALSFQSLDKLASLKLRRNHIRHLRDGAFWGLKSIKVLELDWNYISVVSKVWVYGLSHLRSLSLSTNVITHIETDVWEFCRDLQELNLSTNHIHSVQKGTLKHLSKLEILNLNNNNISYIEEDAFSNTPGLRVLLLNNNKLSWTVEDMNGAFSGLSNLLKFYLASNSIKSISRDAFTELSSVALLDIASNNITTVQNDSFSAMLNLKELSLNTSMLLCDCNLLWFAQWLRDNGFKSSQVTVECAYPEKYRGRSVLHMTLSSFKCSNGPKPELTEEPKMKMALKGENVSLFCRAKSSSPSPMTFVWKLDNIELKDAVVTETESPDGNSTERLSELRLFNVSHNDQGRYQCIVTNSFGTTYSQKSRISVLIFPKFSKMPANITVNTGNTAKLECAAHGEPQPQIAWQKDGGNDFPAARERRMHVMPTDDVFFIVNAKTTDMGVYSCTAQNPAGVIVANATLTVLEVPSFVKPMENKETTAGEPIVLECMAGGSPRPTLTWLKDGGPLRATDRHFFTAEDQLMIIVDTTLGDAGTYECLMNNSLGTERGHSELLVIPGTPVTDDDMMGIIIITVVCCAVGTSVVWVVIIYQTRKRIGSQAAAAATTAGPPPASCPTADNSSERSSCKDSGTGDSAKRSSLSDNFNVLLCDRGVAVVVSAHAQQPVLAAAANNAGLHSPLLPPSTQSPATTSPPIRRLSQQLADPRSTNHDRAEPQHYHITTSNHLIG